MTAMKRLKHRKHHVQNATKRLEVGFLNGIKPVAKEYKVNTQLKLSNVQSFVMLTQYREVTEKENEARNTSIIALLFGCGYVKILG